MIFFVNITYFDTVNGISLEHMIRYGKFDMRVKHFHNEYEIFYILEGERLFFFNNRNFVASKGDLILVDTNLIHMTKSVSADDSGHNRIILYVNSDKMQELDKKYPPLQLVRFFHQHYGIYHLTPQQQEHFMDLYYLFKRECREKKHNYKQAVELAVTTYFLGLTRELDIHAQEGPLDAEIGKNKHVYEIADYLSQHCEQPLSLDELAGRFYLSKYYACRAFKEVTGYTISEYVNIHRIQRAKRYLEETTLSISEIADMVGYGTMTHFEKTFKIYMTISPLKYRKTLNIVTHTNLPTNP